MHGSGTADLWTYEAVRDCLTSERLSSYLGATNGHLDSAFQLYEWNMRAAAGVLSLTSMVEVITRNALDEQLVGWAAERREASTWFDVAPLDNRGIHDLRTARERATRDGRIDEVHGKVIAELSIGFWRFLVESRYLASLWVPATHRAFPGGSADLRQQQRDVAARMKRLTFVRNRAAHHEPIHRWDLVQDLHAALELSSWVSPAAGGWVRARNVLIGILTTRPRTA